MTLESVLVVTIGSLLGGAAALMALIGSAGSLSAQVGNTVHVVISWPAVAAAVAGCLVFAVGTSALPALRLTRSVTRGGG